MNKNGKKLALIVLAVLLVLTIVGGTVAWLTRTDKLTNTFTVGTFEVPTKDPEGKDITIDSHLYEPSWNSSDEHKLLPGTEYEKDPYVGLGEGSEDAVVYVYVENNFSNKVYFELNAGWEKVEAVDGYLTDTYTSGLFKYTAGLSGASAGNVWTTAPVFSKIVVDESATKVDFEVSSGKNTEITVSSFIHQVSDGNGNEIDSNAILAAAKEAFGIQ